MASAISSKNLKLTSFLAAVAWAAGADSAQAKPMFEFMGVRAGQVVDQSSLRSCAPDDAGNVRCEAAHFTLAGKRQLGPLIYLRDGKLAQMFLSFSRADFLAFSSAFTDRYGKPCKTEYPKWENLTRSTSDTNEVIYWCFASGTLELARLSGTRNFSHAIYSDTVTTLASKEWYVVGEDEIGDFIFSGPWQDQATCDEDRLSTTLNDYLIEENNYECKSIQHVWKGSGWYVVKLTPSGHYTYSGPFEDSRACANRLNATPYPSVEFGPIYKCTHLLFPQ